MMKSNGKREEVEELLLNEYEKKGYILEDEIIDTCIAFDLDLVAIDALCDKLLSQKMIVKDAVSDKVDRSLDDESFVDRSHLDYDVLLSKMQFEFPNCKVFIENVKGIKPPQSKEWQILIKEAQSGNEYARHRMVLMYLRTVLKLAYDFSKANYCDFEEAFQNGVMGLIKAIEKFDVTSPDRFPAYFPLWVINFMRRYSTVKGTIMRYPVHYMDRLNIIIAKACILMEDDDYEAAVDMIDDYHTDNVFQGISKEHVLPYVEVPDNLVSEEDILDKICENEMAERLHIALSKLKERERNVIELRYGLLDGAERTLEEVGIIHNVTRERIRQIEAKAIKKLQVSLRRYS